MEFRTLEANEIECRVASVTDKSVTLLLYKDARVDMKLLDEVFGCENWQKTYESIDGRLYCTVSIWDAEKHMWIAKQDVGTESNMEKEKGQASDAFKRASTVVGIGRELYTAPQIVVTAEDTKIGTGKSGNKVCYDHFHVEQIVYSEREIVALSIKNDRTGKRVFLMDKRPKKDK